MLGGYVYARVFYEIYETDHTLYPEDFPHHTYINASDSNENIDEQFEPTLADMLAYEYAIESFRDFEHYGLPYEGGSREQPYRWKLALDCVNSAMGAARAQAAAEARVKQREDA